jgi:hypothetical protein
VLASCHPPALPPLFPDLTRSTPLSLTPPCQTLYAASLLRGTQAAPLPAATPQPPELSVLPLLACCLLLGSALPACFGELHLGCQLLLLVLPSLLCCAALYPKDSQLDSGALEFLLLAPTFLLLCAPLPPAYAPSLPTLLLSAAPLLALSARTAVSERHWRQDKLGIHQALVARNLATATFLSWGPVALVLLVGVSLTLPGVMLSACKGRHGQQLLHPSLTLALAALCSLVTVYHTKAWLPPVRAADAGYLLWAALECAVAAWFGLAV